jgi:hypothetical protein
MNKIFVSSLDSINTTSNSYTIPLKIPFQISKTFKNVSLKYFCMSNSGLYTINENCNTFYLVESTVKTCVIDVGFYSGKTLCTEIQRVLNVQSTGYIVSLDIANKIHITNSSITFSINVTSEQLKRILGFTSSFVYPINLLQPYSLLLNISNFHTQINYGFSDVHFIIPVTSSSDEFTRFFEQDMKQSIKLSKDDYLIMEKIYIKIMRSDGYDMNMNGIDFELLIEFSE